MHIRWLAHCLYDASTLETSHLASHRYRTVYPVRALRAKGHRVDITTTDEMIRGADLSGDVIVVGKVFVDTDSARFATTSQLMLAAASDALGKVVGDINDNNFDNPHTGHYWRKLCTLIDVCVAGSHAMGQTVRRYTSAPVVTLGDPLGSPKGVPHIYRKRVFFRKPLKIAWYGAPNNSAAMFKAAHQVAASVDHPLEFHLITTPHEQLSRRHEEFTSKHPRTRMTLHPWSLEAQWKIVSECDLVMIPSDPADPNKAVKSANRLTDALHAGRYVIASPIPAYMPYSDVASVTHDMVAAVQLYLREPNFAMTRLVAGQAKVEVDCGIDAIADQWLKAFSM